MLARSVLVTGCCRGLGLELVRQLTSRTEILIATCRNPEKATELKDLDAKHPNIKMLPLDVLAFDSFSRLAQQVSAIVGDKGLNLLINNAGVFPRASSTEAFYTDEMAETYAVNVIGPAKLTKAFLPLLQAAGKSSENDGKFHVHKALVVNMSSRLGSIGSITDSFYLPYRCSKAALNMVTKCLSCELKNDGIAVISMHLGWVKTDMGTSEAPLTAEESMSLFVQTLHKITPEQTGQFLDWKGDRSIW